MPTVQVFPTTHHFANAIQSVQVVKNLGFGRSVFFTIDNVTVQAKDMLPAEMALWLHRIADQILDVDEAHLRGLTMDQLQLVHATEDAENGF